MGKSDSLSVMGRVSRIQRACTGDGPGYRTTVFFQGCHLHCPWCHNPDYRPFGERLSRNTNRCLGCGRCDDIMAPDSVGDIGKRVRECPAGALSLLGREMSVAEVIGVVRRDISYYRDTGGGVTLSGGEPLTQPEFALALADAARAEGISVAIETSCAVPESVVVRFADACIDLFLCGIKASRADYQRLIGVDPDLVLKNIFTLAASGRAVTLRVPCVVGLNFNEGLAEFINEAAAIKGVGGVELLPYHNFGRGKATMAGLPEPDWSEMRAPDEEELVEFARGLKLPGKR